MGVLPKRTIRFILFSGEEQGTIGSHEYVKAHAAELDKIRAVIVFDDGSGRTSGFSLGGRTDTDAPLRQILKPLETWNVGEHTPDASFGTDNFDFLLEGVPTFVANQEVSNYLANYHGGASAGDRQDDFRYGQRRERISRVAADQEQISGGRSGVGADQ